MKKTLVVVADLACYKAYKIDGDQAHSKPRLELLEEYENADAHGKIVDKVTDLAGRFPRGSSPGAMSDGERHNMTLEMRKRLVRQLAQRLSALAGDKTIERCLLAASLEINRQLVEELQPDVRAKIQKNLVADLTKVERAELLRYFEPTVAAVSTP